MGRVSNKVAIVTGGSKGLGLAVGELLAREGAKVALTDIDDKTGEAEAEKLRNQGLEVIYLHQDVSDAASWDKVVDKVVSKFGKLDILVNNAGIAINKNIEDETLEGWRKTQAINLDGVFLGTQAGIKAMKKIGGGSIINLSSIEGLIGDPLLTAYNASKGGVRIFSKSAALHVAKQGYGIRINTVHPGYIWTPMVEKLCEIEPDRAEYLKSLHPIGRLGRPEDVAYGVLYLASDESSFVTGSELVIDGGYTAQ